CTLFCHSVATFLTSVSSYEGGCGFEGNVKAGVFFSAALSAFPVSCFFSPHETRRDDNKIMNANRYISIIDLLNTIFILFYNTCKPDSIYPN
ncbi:hypothetical protein, partial [Phocaeicola massiliensis]|uniref:hypothetical protein n=1 Tax=Phocaeicola massiliensis TaxID=204516 RepID=UPI001E3E385A